MTHDYEALAAALQLLLGDVPDDQKRAVFYKAFPDSFIMLRVEGGKMRDQLRLMRDNVEAALNIVDGSSGLGPAAAKNANVYLKDARARIRLTAGILGISL